jgi:hypothetical protein
MAPYSQIADTAGRVSVALDAVYHYGDDRDPASFGWRASLSSVAHGLAVLRAQIQDGLVDVEEIAAAVHSGWGYAVLAYWDPRGYCSPRPAHTALDGAVTVDSVEGAEASLAGRLLAEPRFQPADFENDAGGCRGDRDL